MSDLWLKVLQMSLSASGMVLAVAVVRRVVDRAPKWMWVLLWGLVGVRLMCPISLKSVWSMAPRTDLVLEPLILSAASQAADGATVTGQGRASTIANATPVSSWSWTTLLAVIWLLGVVGMCVYACISQGRLRQKIKTAIPLEKNLYESENLDYPFVLGVMRPRIYLPTHLSRQERSSVMAHERAHIRRGDHWWKPLGFFVLAVHWFNPVVWLGYVLFCRDLELACDESVIRSMGRQERADYSQALLTYSAGSKGRVVTPLAFGEVGVQRRIREILLYQRPTVWGIGAVVCLGVVVSVCFLTDPVDAAQKAPVVEVVTPEEDIPQQSDEGENWLDWYTQTVPENTGSLEEDKTGDAKLDLFNQMLNTMEFYNRLDLTMETSMLSQATTTVEYHIDLDAGTSYQATWENGELYTEMYSQNHSKVTINRKQRVYEVEHSGYYSREDAYYIPLAQRIAVEEDGMPCYRYRRDATNCSLSAYCVDPQELAYSYLADMEKWDIVDDGMEYLGRTCVKIQGTTSDYIAEKHSADHFTMLVDKETGILLDFQATLDGRVTRYMSVTELELEGSSPIKTFDLEDYSGFSPRYQ